MNEARLWDKINKALQASNPFIADDQRLEQSRELMADIAEHYKFLDGGLSFRQKIARSAFLGLCSNPASFGKESMEEKKILMNELGRDHMDNSEFLAINSFEFADAWILQSQKEAEK